MSSISVGLLIYNNQTVQAIKFPIFPVSTIAIAEMKISVYID